MCDEVELDSRLGDGPCSHRSFARPFVFNPLPAKSGHPGCGVCVSVCLRDTKTTSSLLHLSPTTLSVQYICTAARCVPCGLPHPQVCNHPELFEGQAERWPLQFADSSTAIDDALQPVAPVVLAGPGRPSKAPAGTTWVQVTGFRSHIQVGAGRPPGVPGFLFCSPSEMCFLVGLSQQNMLVCLVSLRCCV